ncbi:MAG: hypothetical protein Ta2D_03760 [Rickettsiales bacterium]|nr:MAG: hypothetical protein Ta2D_03760 [Rickettsiales bacterium]
MECEYIRCNNASLRVFGFDAADKCDFTDLTSLNYRSSGLAGVGLAQTAGAKIFYTDNKSGTAHSPESTYDNDTELFISCPTTNPERDSSYVTNTLMKVKCESGIWKVLRNDACTRTQVREVTGYDPNANNLMNSPLKDNACFVSDLASVNFRTNGLTGVSIASTVSSGIYLSPDSDAPTYISSETRPGTMYYLNCPEVFNIDGKDYDYKTLQRMRLQCSGSNGSWIITDDICEGVHGLTLLVGRDPDAETIMQTTTSGFRCTKSDLGILTFRTRTLTTTSLVSSEVKYYNSATTTNDSVLVNDYAANTKLYIACPVRKVINGVEYAYQTNSRMEVQCNTNGTWSILANENCVGGGEIYSESDSIVAPKNCLSADLTYFKFRSKGLAKANIKDNGIFYNGIASATALNLTTDYSPSTDLYVACPANYVIENEDPSLPSTEYSYTTNARMHIKCDASNGRWKVEGEDSCDGVGTKAVRICKSSELEKIFFRTKGLSNLSIKNVGSFFDDSSSLATLPDYFTQNKTLYVACPATAIIPNTNSTLPSPTLSYTTTTRMKVECDIATGKWNVRENDVCVGTGIMETLSCVTEDLSQIKFRTNGLENTSITNGGSFFDIALGGSAISTLPDVYTTNKDLYVACPDSKDGYAYATGTRMKISCNIALGLWEVKSNEVCTGTKSGSVSYTSLSINTFNPVSYNLLAG